MEKYKITTYKISKIVTKEYSTSFFTASSLFHKEIKKHIFNIYGFVRFADEIVDTFHEFDKEKLLTKFENDYFEAFQSGISLNPILHAFQDTVRKFNIPQEYIQAFLNSMRADLYKTEYKSNNEIENYIYGSADVVGLMCLKVFCCGNDSLFEQLKLSALKLGSAFQKVNFLRDLKVDTENLGRIYFPQLINNQLNEEIKKMIILNIEKDFEIAYNGIKNLPNNSKLAVFTAYLYYSGLLRKIKRTHAQRIVSQRIRISNCSKIFLLLKAYIKYKLNLI